MSHGVSSSSTTGSRTSASLILLPLKQLISIQLLPFDLFRNLLDANFVNFWFPISLSRDSDGWVYVLKLYYFALARGYMVFGGTVWGGLWRGWCVVWLLAGGGCQGGFLGVGLALMWEEWVVISWGLAKTGAACVAKLVVWIGGGLGSRIVKGVGASLICVILTGVALGVREGLVSGEDNGWRDVGYAGSGRGLSVSGRVGVGKIRVLEWVCGVAHIVVVCYGVWVGTGLASGGLFDIRRVSGLGEEVSWCGCSIGVGLWRGFCIGSVGVFGGEGWKMGVIVLDVGESRCFGRVWSVAALVVGFEPMGDGGGGGGVRLGFE
ncbi:hypothetical protein Tco_1070597 [Tanacetum coccineum]|uniref:Transmembrane protein n=1 Tax=Tanacetum coccineum TaxID=301880 RepID=A0ABQ5HLV7_9ASTR